MWKASVAFLPREHQLGISKKIGYIISTDSSHEFYCVKSDYTKLHEISYFLDATEIHWKRDAYLILKCFSYIRMLIQGGTSKRDMKREFPYSVLHYSGGSASQSGEIFYYNRNTNDTLRVFI